ncbi:MAG TPA: hypothetical protein VFS20_13300 [Longimicrobium sp.]|nr:hypothetical protein [Longimicrobium sp.]
MSVPDALVAALELPALRSVPLRRGERELRLWPSNGPVAPSMFVRVVDGRDVDAAEIFAYWREGPLTQDPGLRATFEARVLEQWQCGPIRYANGYGFCRVKVADPARAGAVVAYLDSIGAWGAADSNPNGDQMVIQLDGQSLGMEIRRGSRYDAQRYMGRNLTAGSRGEALFRLHTRI